MASTQYDPWSEQTPRRSYGCAVVLVIALVGGGIFIWYLVDRNNNDALEAAITASAGRLTLEKDDGDTLKALDRKGDPEVWFRVTLENAPIGRELPLTCEWFDPAGKVLHRNQYKTKEITHTPWPTHARYRISADAALGAWTVRLLLGGRELRVLTFDVQ